MKPIEKPIRVLLCMMVCILFFQVPLTARSEGTAIEGIRWFPVLQEKQFDAAWEVECIRDGCVCRPFYRSAEDMDYPGFLDIAYTAEGGLTITRNGNDLLDGGDYGAENTLYWPRIRTAFSDTFPEIDLRTANTLYFDFTAAQGTSWNILLDINGYGIRLSKVIAEAVGVSGVETSDSDAPSGTYKGSINLQQAIDELCKEEATLSALSARSLKEAEHTVLPRVEIFCVGPVGASITIHELFLSTAQDTVGAKCAFADMGLLSGKGESYYQTTDDGGTPPSAIPSRSGDYQYIVREDGTAEITGYTGDATVVTVPSALDGYTVSGIRDMRNGYIQELVVPDTVTYIGDYAFCAQEQLRVVTLPAGLSTIGECAFENCHSIVDLYYNGTQEQFAAIVLGVGNGFLLGGRIHYGPTATTTTTVPATTTVTSAIAATAVVSTTTTATEMVTTEDGMTTTAAEIITTVAQGTTTTLPAVETDAPATTTTTATAQAAQSASPTGVWILAAVGILILLGGTAFIFRQKTGQTKSETDGSDERGRM